MLIRFICLLLVLHSMAWALDCENAQRPSGASIEVQKMLDTAGDFRSVEDFLIGLPAEMKSNFTIMADSRSFHASSVESPRIVLSSDDGRVRVSYNTKPNSRGVNAVEISIWNPETMTFDYKEIKAKSPNAPLVTDQNPIACANCHGNPPKPNLEAPDRVPGAIPFARETVVSNSLEAQWYKTYLERIEERSPENFRYNILKPDVGLEEFRTREAAGSTVQVSKLASGSRPEQYYEQSSQLMRCFHAKRMRERANFANLKYLLAGLKQGCEPASFLQDWNFQAGQNYFQGRIPNFIIPQGTPEQRYKALREQIILNTFERQSAGQRRAEGRQKAFWLEVMLNPSEVEEELTKNTSLISAKAKNAQAEAQKVATVRMLLEPLGIQLSRFSLSRDPFDYNFGGEFESDYILQKDLDEILSQKPENVSECDFLAERNKVELENLKPKAEKFSLSICEQRERIDAKMKELMAGQVAPVEAMIRDKAQTVFNDKCLACHKSVGESGSNIGALVIPFNDISKVENLLTSDFGRLNELKDVMRDRINRPHGHQGAMPVSFVTDMTEEQKAYLSLWLDGVGRTP